MSLSERLDCVDRCCLIRFDQETGECGCQSMEQVSYTEFGSYQRPKGPDMEFPCGYSTLIRYLTSQIPTSWILFQQFVENIDWDSPDRIRIKCNNGKIYECDHVISTIPLAVMKWNYKSLFTPALPRKTVEKDSDPSNISLSLSIISSLESRSDPKDGHGHCGQNLSLLRSNEFLRGWFIGHRLRSGTWYLGHQEGMVQEDLPLSKSVRQRSAVLDHGWWSDLLWTIGGKSYWWSADQSLSKIIEERQHTLANESHSVSTETTRICFSGFFSRSRTQWFANPCAKGSYSYVPVGASSWQHIRDLAEPLTVQNTVSAPVRSFLLTYRRRSKNLCYVLKVLLVVSQKSRFRLMDNTRWQSAGRRSLGIIIHTYLRIVEYACCSACCCLFI